MKENIIASRYASGLIKLEDDVKKLDSILNDLLDFNYFLFSTKLKRMFNNPLIKKQSKYKIVDDFSSNFKTKYATNFIKFLIKKNRIVLYEQIIENFTTLLDTRMGNIKVTLKVLEMPDKSEMKLIEEQVKKYFKGEVFFDIEIDSSILGGFVAYSKNMLLDFSLRNQLLKLGHNIFKIKI